MNSQTTCPKCGNCRWTGGTDDSPRPWCVYCGTKQPIPLPPLDRVEVFPNSKCGKPVEVEESFNKALAASREETKERRAKGLFGPFKLNDVPIEPGDLFVALRDFTATRTDFLPVEVRKGDKLVVGYRVHNRTVFVLLGSVNVFQVFLTDEDRFQNVRRGCATDPVDSYWEKLDEVLTERFNRTVAVENALREYAVGKRETLSREDAKRLADKLGIPDKYRNDEPAPSSAEKEVKTWDSFLVLLKTMFFDQVTVFPDEDGVVLNFLPPSMQKGLNRLEVSFTKEKYLRDPKSTVLRIRVLVGPKTIDGRKGIWLEQAYRTIGD